VVDQRKQAVSIRLGESDIRNIKRFAERLGVRDSDIIRFAIKSTLSRIAPLCDSAIRGRNLVPVLVESGDELIRYFELDAFRLESIINEHVEEGRQVDRDDIALLAMSGLREQYLFMRQHDGAGVPEEAAVPARSLRTYLYDKYVYRQTEHRPTETTPRETTPRESAPRESAPRENTSRVADHEARAGQRPAA
jgi:(2Fe-2S) ferredoxin